MSLTANERGFTAGRESAMNATRVLRAAEAASFSRKAPFNRYKARKPWPPDFSKLDLKYQFRLERRYRRRSQLKWTRPGWIKGVKLAQWGICLCKTLFLALGLALRSSVCQLSLGME